MTGKTCGRRILDETLFPLCLLFVLAVPFTALGQSAGVYIASANEKERAEQLLEKLSTGVLIVRLHSDRRKIDELERLSSRPGMDEKAKKRFHKMLETTREENLAENRAIMDAIHLNYDFSEIFFMHDTASHLLKSGAKSGYFLNQDLEIDPSITLNNDNWLILHLRRESPVLFVVLDQELNQVTRPFPVPVKPGFGRNIYMTPDGPQKNSFPLMSYSKKKQDRYFSIMMNNWNDRLKKFHLRVNEKED